MTFDQAKAILSESFHIAEESDISYGKQMRLGNGAVVRVFDNGKIQYQGKNYEEVRAFLDNAMQTAPFDTTVTGRSISNKVFVVYGHDRTSRDHLELLLRRWGLEPVILDNLPSEGRTLIEKLTAYTHDVKFGIVLATPDDEGHARNKSDEKMFRARQNVVLELGMLLAVLGRERVAILLKNPSQMERPSDIQGLIYLPYETDIVQEAGNSLAREIQKQLGITIDASKL